MIEVDSAGIQTRFVPQGDGTVLIERHQDCQAVIDHVQMRRDMPMRKDLRYIGSVPNVLLEKWMAEVGPSWWKMTQRERTSFLVRKIKDRDYCKLSV